MSINVTSHQKSLKTLQVNVLNDYDRERKLKKLEAERRKERLKQVREKSDEIAKKIRENADFQQRNSKKPKPGEQNKSKNLGQAFQIGKAHSDAAKEIELEQELMKPRSYIQTKQCQCQEETSNPTVEIRMNIDPEVMTVSEDSSFSTTTSSTTSCSDTSDISIIKQQPHLSTTKPVILEVKPETVRAKKTTPLKYVSPPKVVKHFKQVSDLINKKSIKEKVEKADKPKSNSDVFSTHGTINIIQKISRSPTKKSKVVMKAQETQAGETVSLNNNGQTFDYNNKFKNFNVPAHHIVKETKSMGTTTNACVQANIENEVQQVCDENYQKKLQKTQERGERALEREAVRRDFQELKFKLDSLGNGRTLLPTDASTFQGKRKYDKTKFKEKITEAVTSIFKEPVLITCPLVDSENNTGKLKAKKETKREINVVNEEDDNSNSSSCCSILLDVCNQTSRKVSRDIRKNENNDDKCKKLEKLLNKIESIKAILLKELEKCNVDTRKDLKQMAESLSAIVKQRQNIIKNETEEATASTTKKSKDKENRTIMSGNTPMKITIKVKNNGKTVLKQKPSTPNNNNSKSDTSRSAKKIKSKVELHSIFKDEKSESSSSTAYLSPPERVETELDKVIKTTKPPKEQTLEPQLSYYIQRLLGMSRTSINALGVSSSDIQTPNSSTVETITNRSQNTENENSINEAENIIAQNYQFIDDLSKSMTKQTKRTERIWDDSLKSKSTSKSPVSVGPQKPILKNNEKSSQQHNDIARQPGLVDELTENVAQRISELNNMINQVRLEKQKILELTISSVTDFKEDSKETPADESTHKNKDVRLKKHTIVTMSRDSGISSRPESAQLTDYPHNPDHLSTILEVDSPNIPKANTSAPSKVNNISTTKFQSFNDYLIDSKHVPQDVRSETSSKAREDLNDIIQRATLKEIQEIENMNKNNFRSFTTFLKEGQNINEKSFQDLIKSVRITEASFKNFSTVNNDDKPECSNSSGDESSIDIMTELKKRDLVSTKTSSSTPNDESLEKYFGTCWNSMLQKTKESNIVSSSSSNNKPCLQVERPLNLREFLTKELEKKTNTTTSSNEDSISSSMIKSIFGSISPSVRRNDQKTSTPVPESNSGDATENYGSGGNLFSAESRVSSVHLDELSYAAPKH